MCSSHKEVGTYLLWYGFSTAVFLARVYLELIVIIGRWYSNSFLWYIQIQVSELSKGVSNLMVSNIAFYTIPKVEVIYYTPGQPGVQSHRLNPQLGLTNSTTSSLYLPRLHGPQGRNTHATCSEISEQQRGKMVQFSFTLTDDCPESYNFRDERKFQISV